ncbi:NUDIX domain-containing protein [Nonomuraea fastidiosa]|uniref:NUDIX domain-containing protein n=1 Tax=Nonomuraea TaxID=83681 RepID=UPI00324E1AB0
MTAPFARVKIRTGALVFCGAHVALIRRDRPTGSHYTPPGGNVHTGEHLIAALGRELTEELRSTSPTRHHPSCAGSRTSWSPGPAPPRRRASST